MNGLHLHERRSEAGFVNFIHYHFFFYHIADHPGTKLMSQAFQ
jgi:hypothetical protein